MSTSRNTQLHVATNSSGAILSGLSPTWRNYYVSTNGAAYASTTGPSIAEIGSTGIYETDLALVEGKAAFGVADFGATASPRYVAFRGRYEDTLTPVSLGGGSESVTLTVTVDGGAMQGVRVEARSSGTLVAQGYTGVSGTIVLALDPGTYVVRCVRAGASFNETTVVVTDPDTATPSSIDGTSIASAAETPPGLTGSVAYTAPVYDGAIGPLAARDSWTLTRSVTSLPANISSAKFTIQARGKTATSLVDNTTTVTDSTSPTGAVQTVIDADDLSLSAGTYDYDWELTLADGSVRTVERGVLTVVGHPTP